MYISAGLNCNSAMISKSAISDHWPPLSSIRLCFHMFPSCTLISSLYIISYPSSGCSLAKFPRSSSAKMLPKFLHNRILSSVFQDWGQHCACIPIDLLPHSLQGIALVLVQLLDGLLDLSLSFSTVPSIFFRLALCFLTLNQCQCVTMHPPCWN